MKGCVIDNCFCKIKITHQDTMKYRDKIANMPPKLWALWLNFMYDHTGIRYHSRVSEFAFLVRCLKTNQKVKA